MASLNKIFLLGNLTRDPELRHTPGGNSVASFDLAVNRTFATASGEKKEDTLFTTVVVWGKAATAVGEFLKKGHPALVEGRLQYRTWDDKDGVKHSKHEVVADRVQFLSRRSPESPEPPDPHDTPF